MSQFCALVSLCVCAMVICKGSDITPSPADTLPLWFTEAFNDVSAGLSVSCGASPKGTESPVVSISILSRNLPLGLFLGAGAALKQGVVFKPGSLSPLCAFPTNAYTDNRQNVGPAANSTLPRECGVFNVSAGVPQEWQCQYSSQEYVAKFYNYPLKTVGPITVWELPLGTCHFTDIATMLQAEQGLLQRSITPPLNVSEEQWNTRLEGGPTFWNEVVTQPFGPEEVAGVFWSHQGTFRKPQKEHNDTQACIAAQNLKDAVSELPVFEFANFDGKFHFTVDDLKAWSNTLHAGGPKVTDHFRTVDRAEFLEVLETDLCKNMNVRDDVIVV